MKVLLSTFLLFIPACAGPQSSDPQADTSIGPSGISSRVQLGMETVMFDAFIPFQLEQGEEGFRFAHPILSVEYNDEQGMLVLIDVPESNNESFEKMALLVRREHIEALNDPDTAAFMKQIAEEFSQYWEEGEYEDPSEFGMDFAMRIVEGINEEGLSPSACLYQLIIAWQDTGSSCESCAAGQVCAGCAPVEAVLDYRASLWSMSGSTGYASAPVTLNLPKADGEMATFNVNGAFTGKPHENANLSEASFSFQETENSWVYSINYLPLVVNYLENVLPVSIETHSEMLACGQPFLREAWFVLGLPSLQSFQAYSTEFILDAVTLADEVVAAARGAGHLTPTMEVKISEADYHSKSTELIDEAMNDMVEEVSNQPFALMMLGTEIRIGLAASSPELVEYAPGYFNFEIPTDRQVIEVVSMFDMFARMGLTQMQGEWEEEEAF